MVSEGTTGGQGLATSVQVVRAKLLSKYAGDTESLSGKYINGLFGAQAAEDFIKGKVFRNCIEAVRNEYGAISREECLKHISP